MKAISEGMGNGMTKKVDLNDVIDEEWCEYMVCNLKLKTSHVLF